MSSFGNVNSNRQPKHAALFFGCWLLVAANVPNSPILVTLMMGVTRSSETSVLTRATWRNNPGCSLIFLIGDVRGRFMFDVMSCASLTASSIVVVVVVVVYNRSAQHFLIFNGNQLTVINRQTFLPRAAWYSSNSQ
jgi:hypothetical protein